MGVGQEGVCGVSDISWFVLWIFKQPTSNKRWTESEVACEPERMGLDWVGLGWGWGWGWVGLMKQQPCCATKKTK